MKLSRISNQAEEKKNFIVDEKNKIMTEKLKKIHDCKHRELTYVIPLKILVREAGFHINVDNFWTGWQDCLYFWSDPPACLHI